MQYYLTCLCLKLMYSLFLRKLEGRLSVLLHKLNMVADKQSHIEDAEKITKVSNIQNKTVFSFLQN